LSRIPESGNNSFGSRRHKKGSQDCNEESASLQ
jgi:hypothetical protein